MNVWSDFASSLPYPLSHVINTIQGISRSKKNCKESQLGVYLLKIKVNIVYAQVM